MASLIVHYNGQKMVGVFKQRALIGASHLTAWRLKAARCRESTPGSIAMANGITSPTRKSRGGTTVNGQKITTKTILHDGDEIGIGPAKLVFRVKDDVPPGGIRFDIAENGSNPTFKDPGILIRCDCGGPLWVPKSMAGAYGECNHCGEAITVPVGRVHGDQPAIVASRFDRGDAGDSRG